MKTYLIRLMVIIGLSAGQSVFADTGDWLVRIGGHQVNPTSNNHDIVSVETGTMLTFTGTYFLSDSWAVEVLAALPFTHDIKLIGGSKVADTKQLPPTLSMQYHFMPNNNIRPYVGAGVNVTLFFDEGTTGALDDNHLSLGTSVGLAGQLGVDIDLTEKVFLNFDARYMNISTKAKLDGVSIGKVKIDPWVYGVSLGFRF